MTALEQVIDELKHLPPEKVAEVASYVHSLREESKTARNEAMSEIAKRFSEKDVCEIRAVIDEECERVDDRDW